MRLKKPAVLLLCLLLLASCAKKQEPDVRGAVWDTSPDEVIETEATEFIYYDDDMVLFTDDFYGETADITYVFADEKLVSVRADFVIGGRILKDIMESYDAMAASLTEVYGEPVNPDKKVWSEGDAGKSPEYIEPPGSDNPEDDDVYIYYHYLRYILEWRSDRTLARLVLEMTNQTDIFYYFEAQKEIAAAE